jgi:hypothetical protein
VIYEARISQLFQQFHYGEEPQPLKRLRSTVIAATEMKLGVTTTELLHRVAVSSR